MHRRFTNWLVARFAEQDGQQVVAVFGSVVGDIMPDNSGCGGGEVG